MARMDRPTAAAAAAQGSVLERAQTMPIDPDLSRPPTTAHGPAIGLFGTAKTMTAVAAIEATMMLALPAALRRLPTQPTSRIARLAAAADRSFSDRRSPELSGTQKPALSRRFMGRWCGATRVQPSGTTC
jgi:hypothetical protein